LIQLESEPRTSLGWEDSPGRRWVNIELPIPLIA